MTAELGWGARSTNPNGSRKSFRITELNQGATDHRTFSWFGRNRRLAEDFENLAETLATFLTLSSIQLALRRLARAYVGKSDRDETFAGMADNDGNAPIVLKKSAPGFVT
jgi:hypothetical protein